MNALDYFLKANLYGLLFAGSYWLLLRQHTFFDLNRAYLLVATVLSLALPLANLPTQTVKALPSLDWPRLDWPRLGGPVPTPGLTTLPVTAIAVPPVETPLIDSPTDWEQLGILMYGFVAFVLCVRLAIQIGRLLRLIRRSPKQPRENYVLVQPNDPGVPTFSFFRYIILNPADSHNELIIQHERVHIQQYHSADVVGMGFVRAIFWACPPLWFIDHLLRQVHEFLADKPIQQPTEYARFLFAYSLGIRPARSKPDALTNNFFNASLLKQRIVMLHQKATNRWAMGKYALVLPLMFGLLAMTTARESIRVIVNQEIDSTITVSGRVIDRNGKALSGANVVIANTGKGVPTDQNGFYTLSNVPASATLAFSHIGYRSDRLFLQAFGQRIKHNQLRINPRLLPNLQDELPAMGATAAYKAIKPNTAMPIRIPPSSETVNGQVFNAVEESAVFPTGVPGLMQYVAHHLRYPAKARTTGIQGDVYVIFTVLPTGIIGDVIINKRIRRIGGGCEEEAIRVVRQMPRWIPAQQNNKPVAVRYQIPIRFALEKTEDKRMGQVYPTFFKPTNSLIGDFPTMRDVNFPNQPRLTMTRIPTSSFKADTTPQPGMSIPGMSTTIQGAGPLGPLGGEPLYILDGTPIPADSMKTLNPHTIESLNVIKGSSATATWGEKAKNGAVIITSKKK